MKIITPSIEVENFDGIKIMKNIERACRECYASQDKITEDSYKTLIKNCLSRHHESVMEHEKITVRICSDTGFLKDITRHRLASFSVQSTRYCSYNKDKFGSGITFIQPCNIDENSELYDLWLEEMSRISQTYMKMAQLNAIPDQMRMILPHSTATYMTMTANIREWRHILSLRCSKFAHPSVQQVMIPLLLYFKEQMPELFFDIEYNTEFPKEKYTKVSKMS